MLNNGLSAGQIEQTPFNITGFTNGHSTIVADDFILCFWFDRKTSKSLKGDNKLGASEFVKNVALIHFEFD